MVNNLVALGVGLTLPVGFCGDDGEGHELRRALGALPGVQIDHFLTSPERRTFTYCKPLVMGTEAPLELDRLDFKNWTPTPPALDRRLVSALREVSSTVDAIIVLEQVDREGTGVVTPMLRSAAREIASMDPNMPILADSRRGLRGWPHLNFKMNGSELAAMLGRDGPGSVDDARKAAVVLADRNGRSVFVTLSERGMIGAEPGGMVEHVEALPLRGPIDIVGAGDSVTANLAAGLAAGATLREAVVLAVLASSVVIHQLGSTGTARVSDLAGLLDQIPDRF